METKGFHFENTYVIFGKSMPFWAMPREGGLTGTVIAVEGRIRLWGLLVLLLRRFRAGFHTRIISDKTAMAPSAVNPGYRWVECGLLYAVLELLY
jgi:hypothetical protein